MPQEKKDEETVFKIAISALEKISNPLKYLQKEADKEGVQLNGTMAIHLANDHNYLKGIAINALAEIATSSQPSPTAERRTGEEQDAIQIPLQKYINEHKNQDECSGFIDGFRACELQSILPPDAGSLPSEAEIEKKLREFRIEILKNPRDNDIAYLGAMAGYIYNWLAIRSTPPAPIGLDKEELLRWVEEHTDTINGYAHQVVCVSLLVDKILSLTASQNEFKNK